MSARKWKPGDVAMVTTSLRAPTRATMYERPGRGAPLGRWRLPNGVLVWTSVISVDPIATLTIDPEDSKQVERLARAYVSEWAPNAEGVAVVIPSLQAALRSLIEPPKAPRPDEPRGLGAVIEADGELFVRDKTTTTTAHWKRARGEEGGKRHRYADLRGPITVLSEGVQP